MEGEVVTLSRRGDRVSCDVAAIPDWEGFEKIIRFLEKYYSATVRSKADGPDARRWILEVDGGMIEVQHDDPYGNRVLSMSASADSLVERVALDLRDRLRVLRQD